MDATKSPHPTGQTLSAYGLGKLDERTSQEVDQHLELCLECRRRVGELSSDSFLDRIRKVQPGSDRSVAGGSLIDGSFSLASAKPPSSPPPTDSLPPGLASHSDYQIKRELGRGGMGVVYLAHNTLMGRDEVLKVIGREIMERPGVLERFQREIRAVAKLHHENIVTAYTAFRIEGGLVFAMEYVEGLDLARLVKVKGPMAVSHAAYFAHQAALGLQHAHERGTVHRDIKPHNLMLTHDRKARIVKILDFGLAKASREQKVDSSLTHEGQALGTPDYIAPEQILNATDVDIRADLYSLGGTIYYLLTGRPPFSASSLYDMYQAHISREADPLNLIRPEVPADLAALVAKLMAKEPRRRFQTPGEVAEALKPFFKKGHVEVSPPQVPPASKSTEAKPAGATAPPPPPPASPPPATEPSLPPVTQPVDWSSLIAIREDESVSLAESSKSDSALSSSRDDRKKTVLLAAIGLLSVFLVGFWGTVLKFRTADGTIVLEGLADDDVVEVDGEKVPQIRIRKNQEGEPYLSLTSTKHGVRVTTRDGSEIYAQDELSIQAGGSQTIHLKRIDPEETVNLDALNAEAWELATNASAASRDGARAVELATKACKRDGYQTSSYLDTLAAAHAEAGDFGQAVKWETLAIEKNQGQAGVERYRSRLELFKAQNPYHEGSLSPRQASAGERVLFNGHDFTGWYASNGVKETDPNSMMRIENGELVHARVSGHGYLQTRDSFRDFFLTAKYKFPINGRLSSRSGGVVLNPKSDKFAEYGLECDLTKNGKSGDFCSLKGRFYDSHPRMFGHGSLLHILPTEDAQRPDGQWNDLKIRCEGRVVEVELNGRTVNRVECKMPLEVRIALQCLGTDIHFRDLRLTPLPSTRDGHEQTRIGAEKPVEQASPDALNRKAWDLATNANAEKRDGKKAVELATRACERDGYQTSSYLDTLAAAHAEAGQFDEAVKWETQAVERLWNQVGVERYLGRLGLYRARKPYHEGDPLSTVASAKEFVLFNGKDLTGWIGSPGLPAHKPELFVDQGTLHSPARVGGSLRTITSFQDFALFFEYRAPVGAQDLESGIWLVATKEPEPIVVDNLGTHDVIAFRVNPGHSGDLHLVEPGRGPEDSNLRKRSVEGVVHFQIGEQRFRLRVS